MYFQLYFFFILEQPNFDARNQYLNVTQVRFWRSLTCETASETKECNNDDDGIFPAIAI